MKKVRKKPVKVRRAWLRNPKTQVEPDALIYDRRKEKKRKPNIYGEEELET